MVTEAKAERVTPIHLECLPAPPLDTKEDAQSFLEAELPGWLDLVDGMLAQGDRVPPLLVSEIGLVARRAGTVLRTGEPHPVTNGDHVPDLAPLAWLIRADIETCEGGPTMVEYVMARLTTPPHPRAS